MPILSHQIIHALSEDRFATYLAATRFDHSRALALYLWNAKVGAAFHLPLQGLEIALRNAVNRELMARHGDAWWRNAEFRRDAHRRSMQAIGAALQTLRKRGCQETNANLTSVMSLGFWNGLLATSQVRMWEDPSMNRRMVESVAHIAALRNRIAHHEPIFRRDLLADYGIAMRLLRSICPATHDWIRPHCSVAGLIRQKP